MKLSRISLLLSLLTCFFYAKSQTVIWTEDFQNACTATCLATGYTGTNGSWTVTNTGVNGADANVWYVSGAECGNAAGACGSVCGATDPSLHVGSNTSVLGDQGASYLAGGLGFWFPETDIRAESPTINLTGQSNITLNFNYIENGQTTIDNATLWYFDGATWTQLIDLVKTPLTCNPQGTWTAYSQLLPASANNNANVKIGFRWVNNDDNVGTDPSFAVDDITLTVPSASTPTANFTASATSVCLGGSITFTNTSTTSAPTTYAWIFPGGTPATANTAGPHTVTFNTAGTQNISLTVTDANGTDSIVIPITVNPLPTVTANATNISICAGDPVTLTGGGASSYTWDNGVTDGVPFNPTTTNTYTVTGTDANGCQNTAQITVTVNNCSQPTASFTASSLSTCVGSSITFTDNSTGSGITNWNWTFPGGSPATANTQGPHVVSFSATGTYNINLQITDANGTDDTTITITVNPLPTITASASATTICAGDPVTLTGSGGVSYTWDNGVIDGVPFNPTATTNYTVTGTDANGCQSTAQITVTVNNCTLPTASFTASSLTICEGDSIVFTDNSSSSLTITAWSWTFPGGNPATANTQGPHTVIFSTAGTYNINLQVTDANGSKDTTITISVTACAIPVAGIGMDVTNGKICKNSCIDFSYAGTGGTPTSYNWIFEEGTPSSSSAQNPGLVCWGDTTGRFIVTLEVSNANGTTSITDTVTVSESPVLVSTPDTLLIIGNNVNLTSQATDSSGNPITGGSYLWSPSTDLSCVLCQTTTVIQPLDDGTYIVTYTAENGCVVNDTIRVIIDMQLNIGVPSAFTPNGDGKNDFLVVRGQLVIESLSFSIYNRYGQEIFSTTDKTKGWDGTHNGKELNPGVFVYTVNATMIDGSRQQLKGNVTLIK
ncbi:MAG: PKD domain-containing protein [Vicingaceae bacterium]|nr:PKD domain-containing protein [Vicingaceae bacterium]